MNAKTNSFSDSSDHIAPPMDSVDFSSEPSPENPDAIALPEPRALGLEEAAEAVAARRDKVPYGLDGHLETTQDGLFDALSRAARNGDAISPDEQIQLVSFGLRDGLITPGELSAEALEKAWSLTSPTGHGRDHPPESEA